MDNGYRIFKQQMSLPKVQLQKTSEAANFFSPFRRPTQPVVSNMACGPSLMEQSQFGFGLSVEFLFLR